MKLLELKIDERSDGYVFHHEAMATRLSIWVGGVDQAYAKGAAHTFFQRVDEVESKLSLYQESSDVTRINLLDTGEVAKISTDCVECLVQALEASQLTGSLFHPFLGVESLRAKGNVPPFLRARLEIGSDGHKACIQLDPENRLVQKVDCGSLLDLGGIGKGYALEVALEELEDWEVPAVMANFGGSTLLFQGEGELGTWSGTLGEERFEVSGRQAIASSGVGYQGEHIVTRNSELRGITWLRSFVRCRSAALADALSTATILMSEAELEAIGKGESGLRVAVASDESNWGVNAFCEGLTR